MTDQPKPDGDSPNKLAQAMRIDLVCQEFEQAWRGGKPQRIEQCLHNVPEADRTVILSELVTLEIELRLEGTETPKIDEFRKRFPNDLDLIESVFSDYPELSDESPASRINPQRFRMRSMKIRCPHCRTLTEFASDPTTVTIVYDGCKRSFRL